MSINSKCFELIQYFVKAKPGILRTTLLKYIYLSDLESRRLRGRPITELNYIWYNFGPFDSDFYGAINALTVQSQVEEIPHDLGNGKISYRYKPKSTGDMNSKLEFAESIIAKGILERYRSLPQAKLLQEVVYKTLPMVDAQQRSAFEKPLRMELVDNEALSEAGPSFTDIVEGLEDAKAGRVRPLKDVLNELRNRAHAASTAGT